jgi:hypothetical protein
MDSETIKHEVNIDSAVAFAMGIEGMTVKNALILMSVFIEKLHPIAKPGKIVEFGTYKGRVAALLVKTAREDDSLVLVDFKTYLDFEKFDNANIKYKFHETTSEKWCKSSENSGRFIFSHHDASHFFDNVSTEILS